MKDSQITIYKTLTDRIDSLLRTMRNINDEITDLQFEIETPDPLMPDYSMQLRLPKAKKENYQHMIHIKRVTLEKLQERYDKIVKQLIRGTCKTCKGWKQLENDERYGICQYFYKVETLGELKSKVYESDAIFLKTPQDYNEETHGIICIITAREFSCKIHSERSWNIGRE